MSFGSKLKELRQQKDLSLRKLGEKAAISYSILNSIENDRFQPTKDVVRSIAYALKYDHVDELLELAGYESESDLLS